MLYKSTYFWWVHEDILLYISALQLLVLALNSSLFRDANTWTPCLTDAVVELSQQALVILCQSLH